MNIKKYVVLACLLAIILASCGSSSELDNTRWALTSIDGNSPIEGRQATIEFASGEASGTTGCNSYSGTYKIKEDTISFGPIAQTEMACMDPEGMMEQEHEYLELLGSAQRFELNSSMLRLTDDSGRTLTFERQSP